MSSGWSSGEQITVNQLLAAATAAYSDKVFLDFSGDQYAYAAINQASDAVAASLRALGVERGDTVASILDNSVDAVILWFALNKLGAISVPTNTAYKGEFLRHQIVDSGAKIVLAEADYAQRIIDIKDELPRVGLLICRGQLPSAAALPFALKSFDELRDANAADFTAADVKPGDLSMLIYTSGTTGPSKGCMISHNYICNLGRQAVYCWGGSASDVMWTALPLFHMNALSSVVQTALTGMSLAIYPRFSLSGFWPDIERSGATMVSLLGSMAPLIATAADTEVSQRCFGQIHTVQTAPFPAVMKQKWRERFGAKIMGSVGYGFTEAAMVVYGRLNDPAPEGSSGRRQPDFDVKIVDEYDNELPPGSSGEIMVRPLRPHVCFEGYWNRPADTLKIMRNMWLHTGDIGRFDADGFFFFMDRKKDYLRRRGENISSFEMETTFARHPAIADVAVHAVFSPMGEDDVKVTAVLKPAQSLTEAELCSWCLDKVPYFAVPRYIEFRQDLPRNPTGKVLKYQLRDEGCTAQTWDREKVDFEIKKR
jgi:crotonobetaine/carnitine-CoA ligase